MDFNQMTTISCQHKYVSTKNIVMCLDMI